MSSDDEWSPQFKEDDSEADDQLTEPDSDEPNVVFQQRKRKRDLQQQPTTSKRAREAAFRQSLGDTWSVKTLDGGLSIPRPLWSKLRQHQMAGVTWLWRRARANQGGILGDEMGLGKTVQIITLCVGYFESKMTDPILIIVPCTLQRQWMHEFAKWWPLLKVKMVENKRLRPKPNTVYIVGYER